MYILLNSYLIFKGENINNDNVHKINNDHRAQMSKDSNIDLMVYLVFKIELNKNTCHSFS